MEEALQTIIDRCNPFLMLVFCKSKERAIEVYDWLYGKRLHADVLHGDMSQQKRRQAMERFRKAKTQILVKDIAARGLDVEGVTQVVNFDIPHDPDWYVHRIGRTGRAGNEGEAITFYTADETCWLTHLEDKLGITLERQNCCEKVRRTVKPVRPKKKRLPKRGKSAVGSNKRNIIRRSFAQTEEVTGLCTVKKSPHGGEKRAIMKIICFQILDKRCSRG